MCSFFFSGGKKGPVADCVVKAFKEVTTSGSSRVPPATNIVIDVCSNLKSSSAGAGECIATFSTKSKVDSITPEALTRLCQEPHSLEKMGCLKYIRNHRPSKGSSKAAITLEEVETCLSTPSQIDHVKMTRFFSTGDDPRKVLTGKSFSLEMQLYDQWGVKMLGKPGSGIRVMASINDNNQQGAVMWGLRSNSSVNGIVLLSSLVISQPGDVELKITTGVSKDILISKHSKKKNENDNDKKTLSLSKLTVYENPRMQNSNICLFVFLEAMCPAVYSSAEVENWENTFPNEVGVIPSRLLMLSLGCNDIFASWAVQMYPLAEWSGYIQVQVYTIIQMILYSCCHIAVVI